MSTDHQSPFPSDGSLVVGVRDFLKKSQVDVSPKTISELVNVAFWASLCTEEGVTAPINIAYQPKSKHNDADFEFDRPLDYSVEALVKLSPIIRDGKALLTVSKNSKGILKIGGICSSDEFPNFAIRSNSPGGISITAKEKIVADVIPGRMPRVRKFQSVNTFDNIINDLLLESTLFDAGQMDMAHIVLYHLCKAMLHEHGGTILIVPSNNKAWEKSISFQYKINKNNPGISVVTRQWGKNAIASSVVYDGLPVLPANSAEENRIKIISNAIGAISAVDGATVLNSDFELLGFGAKITITAPFTGAIHWTEPMLRYREISNSEAGGMRHQSAIQFVSVNPGCIAIVASQDRRLTFFRLYEENVVEAESIEALFDL